MTATTARTVTIALPLPPRALNPNASVHYLTKARHAKSYRLASYYGALAHIPRDWRFERATLHIRYLVCAAHPLGNRGRAAPVDRDNCIATIKNAIDGALVDSRLLPDDNAQRLLGITVELVRHTARTCVAGCRGSGVELHVTEAA